MSYSNPQGADARNAHRAIGVSVVERHRVSGDIDMAVIGNLAIAYYRGKVYVVVVNAPVR